MLTIGLVVAIVAVMMPELVTPFVSEHWLRKFFYWRH